MSAADEIAKLKSLEKDGIISADDFEKAKDRLIAHVAPVVCEPARTSAWSGWSIFSEWTTFVVLGVVGLAAVGTTILYLDAMLIAAGLGLLVMCMIVAITTGL